MLLHIKEEEPLKIILVSGSSIPIFEQIMNAIKEEILNGTLTGGEQLPSVRELSRELKVSILTVKKSYDHLEMEGFITTRQGLGSFVVDDHAELMKEEKQKELESNLLTAIRLSQELEIEKSKFIELLDYLYEEVKNDR